MSATLQERLEQRDYMLSHKAEYLKNGTTLKEFNRRIKLLENGEPKHKLKITF